MSHLLYARSIDRRWRKLLRESQSPVLMFFPYVTAPTANTVLQEIEPSRCKLFTVCSVENFASGASCLKTIKSLANKGIEVFHLDRLHAKVVVVSGSAATIGSQNLTALGRANREFSVCFPSPSDSKNVESCVSDWMRAAYRMTAADFEAIEEQAKPLRREFHKLLSKARDQEKLLTSRRRQQATKRADARRQIAVAMDGLSKIVREGVSREMAQDLLRETTYWKKANGLVKIPRNARHIKEGSSGWYLDRGNRFLVGQAIQQCAIISNRWLSVNPKLEPPQWSNIKREMIDDIHECVENHGGERYLGRYSNSDQWIKLGAHWIDVHEFADVFDVRFGIQKTLALMADSRLAS